LANQATDSNAPVQLMYVHPQTDPPGVYVLCDLVSISDQAPRLEAELVSPKRDRDVKDYGVVRLEGDILETLYYMVASLKFPNFYPTFQVNIYRVSTRVSTFATVAIQKMHIISYSYTV